jgi:membrane associated rhomboid family serine protease
MDWSLVLASQGIEAVIAADDSGWGLLVPGIDEQRAREVLRLYQIENRGWRSRHQAFGTDWSFDWASLAWVALVALFFVLDLRFDLRDGGIMDSALLRHGQWWRLFTAVWLHADAGHLASNAVLGFVLLGLVMARYGTMPGLLAAYLTGAGGNLFAAVLTPQPYRSLGASGLVMGCVGLLAIQHGTRRGQEGDSFERPASPWGWRYVFTGLFAGAMLFILLALGPGTDVLAHLGGFLSGLAFATALARLPQVTKHRGISLFSGLAFSALVILPWWFALRH